MTILIVDDEPTITGLLSQMLEGLGAKILIADSLTTAMQKMSEIPPPDLVLLDLRMPPNGPQDSLNAIRAFRLFNPDLIVIPISGMLMEEIAELVQKTGAEVQAIICKDDLLSQNRLLGVICPLLEKSKGVKDSFAIMEKMNTILHPESDEPSQST